MCSCTVSVLMLKYPGNFNCPNVYFSTQIIPVIMSIIGFQRFLGVVERFEGYPKFYRFI